MGIKLANIWEYLRASFWFIPVIMSMIAVGAAFAMLHADRIHDPEGDITGSIWLYAGGPENARQILSTIAGSMIQVAGVVFSITIVALSLSSSQFGPRLLRTFMKDMSTQLVLGSFVATYIYCLVVLRNVMTLDDQDFIPNLSIAFAIILTIINILVLIYFIHHVATSIQADKVIDRVHHELEDGVSRLFPEELGEGDDHEGRPIEFQHGTHPYSAAVEHPGNGYIQALDNESLWKIASEGDLLMVVHFRPGQYVVAGSEVITVHGRHPIPEGLDKKIAGAFILGFQRTPEQDIEFSMDQLVEVALRALSPSLNDPFTAMTSIDRSCSILCSLTGRKFPSPYRYDKDGTLRMITQWPVTFRDVLSTAFGRVRQSAAGNEPVLFRLSWALRTLLEHARTGEQRTLILHQMDMVRKLCEETIPDASDRAMALSYLSGRGT